MIFQNMKSAGYTDVVELWADDPESRPLTESSLQRNDDATEIESVQKRSPFSLSSRLRPVVFVVTFLALCFGVFFELRAFFYIF